MTAEELRLECLRLAQEGANTNADKREVVERARAYADFAAGQNDAEIIDAAQDFVEKGYSFPKGSLTMRRHSP
jgi:hypothetical protein